MTREVPSFSALLVEHVGEYGELLPHVLLADFVGVVEREMREGDDPGIALSTALPILEEAMGSSDESLLDLIGTSFIETIQGTPVAQLVGRFGPNLTRAHLLWTEE